jgi:hypothetical protein
MLFTVVCLVQNALSWWPKAVFKEQTFAFLMLTGIGKAVITFPNQYWFSHDWNRAGLGHFLNGKFKVFSVSVRVQNHPRTPALMVFLQSAVFPPLVEHTQCLGLDHISELFLHAVLLTFSEGRQLCTLCPR